MPHQLRSFEGGELRSKSAATGAFLPDRSKATVILTGDFSPDGGGIGTPTNGEVMGERNMAHIEHVLQQGEGIHR